MISGVAGYSNVGNGNTKFSGSEAGTISVQTGAATAFDAIIRNTSYDDFTLSTGSATANEAGSAGKGGIIFRYTNSSNYYAVTVHWDRWATGRYIVRLKDSNLSGFNSTGDIASYSNAGAITSLEITAEGSSIQVSINGTLRIDVTDSNHPSGSLGFAHYTLWNWEGVSWSGVSVAEVLPVELLKFSAAKWNNAVKLDWATGMEINNDYFDIQKSLDGVEWKSIGEVKGNGNSFITNEYNYVDLEGCENLCYYRLQQFDFNGESEFHGPLVVNSEHQNIKLQIFPNPVEANSMISITSDESVSGAVYIITTDGKINNLFSRDIQKGQTNLVVKELSNQSPGFYFLVIELDNGVMVREKFIVR